MEQDEKAIEVKVGALVLVSLVLLTAFILVLGDVSFSDGFNFSVDFENAGGLKPGADVAISGVNVGTVDQLEFVRKKGSDNQTGVVIRADVTIDSQYAEDVRKDSQLSISRRGVLGEPYIEITTTSFQAPPIEEGANLDGIEPPRMDVIVSKATDFLDTLSEMLDHPDAKVTDLVANAASLTRTLDGVVTENRANIDGTLAGLEKTTNRAGTFLGSLNTAVGEGKSLRQILTNADSMTARGNRIAGQLEGKVGPIVQRILETMANLQDSSDTVRGALSGKKAQLSETVDNVHSTTANLEKAAATASQLASQIESGEGTIGKLLSDREIYANMKELMRILTRRPWKIIWKE